MTEHVDLHPLLSAEWRVVLEGTRVALGPQGGDGEPNRSRSDRVDWDAVSDIACAHRVAPLLLRGLESRIRAVEARGGSVPSSEALAAAIAKTEERQHGLLDHWNIFTKEDEDAAMEAARRGELQELDDAFAEIAGVSRERFLQMVEEHKARRRES